MITARIKLRYDITHFKSPTLGVVGFSVVAERRQGFAFRPMIGDMVMAGGGEERKIERITHFTDGHVTVSLEAARYHYGEDPEHVASTNVDTGELWDELARLRRSGFIVAVTHLDRVPRRFAEKIREIISEES